MNRQRVAEYWDPDCTLTHEDDAEEQYNIFLEHIREGFEDSGPVLTLKDFENYIEYLEEEYQKELDNEEADFVSA